MAWLRYLSRLNLMIDRLSVMSSFRGDRLQCLAPAWGQASTIAREKRRIVPSTRGVRVRNPGFENFAV